MPDLGKEVPVVAGLVLAIINAIQVAAIALPTWAHTVIAVVSIIAGSLVVRANVQPSTPAPVKPPVVPPAA